MSNKQPFDYNTTQQKFTTGNKSGIHTGGADLTTPMSELSYSYSEMVNDMEGSNYGSSKMRMSGASYLKHSSNVH